MRLTISIASLLAIAACAPAAPAPLAPRGAMNVAAPASKTWDAVIDVFASRNIPIKTMDRSSGFIATEEMKVALTDEAKSYADCGKSLFGMRPPTDANYNVRVKGDSMTSSVQVTVLWKEVFPPAFGAKTEICPTKGVWETGAEQEIKIRAEGK